MIMRQSPIGQLGQYLVLVAPEVQVAEGVTEGGRVFVCVTAVAELPT
jgi:hypothetical protein